jgi:hypothetical protein
MSKCVALYQGASTLGMADWMKINKSILGFTKLGIKSNFKTPKFERILIGARMTQYYDIEASDV